MENVQATVEPVFTHQEKQAIKLLLRKGIAEYLHRVLNPLNRFELEDSRAILLSINSSFAKLDKGE